MRTLLNLQTGYWGVAKAGVVVCVASYILFEAYEPFFVWALIVNMIHDIGELDFERVLDSEGNTDELGHLLEVIGLTDS